MQNEKSNNRYYKLVFEADVNEDIQQVHCGISNLMTASEILNTVFPEPIWAVNNLLPVGLTIFAGKPKIGKSWMALQLSKAVSCGGMFLGEQVNKGRVLYLALEDTPKRLHYRMNIQNWPDTQDVQFLTLADYFSKLGSLSNGGMEKLAEQMAIGMYRLVVIDTLSRAIPGDQSDVAEMTRLLAPIQELAHQQSSSVLIVDHHRKGTGFDQDTISDLLGSTAKGAMADTILGLYRQSGQAHAKLAFIGRDIQEIELNISFSHSQGIWSLSDGNKGLFISENQKRVIGFLGEEGESRAKAIQAYIELDKGNTHKLLQDMAANGLIVRTKIGGGVYYKLPQEDDE